MSYRNKLEEVNAKRILTLYGKLPVQSQEIVKSEDLEKIEIGETKSGKKIFSMIDESYNDFSKSEVQEALSLSKGQDSENFFKEKFEQIVKSESVTSLSSYFDDLIIKSESESESESETEEDKEPKGDVNLNDLEEEGKKTEQELENN